MISPLRLEYPVRPQCAFTPSPSGRWIKTRQVGMSIGLIRDPGISPTVLERKLERADPSGVVGAEVRDPEPEPHAVRVLGRSIIGRHPHAIVSYFQA